MLSPDTVSSLKTKVPIVLEVADKDTWQTAEGNWYPKWHARHLRWRVEASQMEDDTTFHWLIGGARNKSEGAQKVASDLCCQPSLGCWTLTLR